MRKMQIKNMVKTTSYHQNGCGLKRLTIPSVGEDVEILELSYTAD